MLTAATTGGAPPADADSDHPTGAANSPAAGGDDDAKRLHYYYPGSSGSAQGGYHVIPRYANVIRICDEGDRGTTHVNDLTFVYKSIVCRWTIPEKSERMISQSRYSFPEQYREAVDRHRVAVLRFLLLPAKIVFVIEKAKLEKDGHHVPDDAPVFVKEEPSPGGIPVQYVEAPDWKVLVAADRIHRRLKNVPDKEHNQILRFMKVLVNFLNEMPQDDSHCAAELLMALQLVTNKLQEREKNAYTTFVKLRGKENPDYPGYLCDKALLVERMELFLECQQQLDKLLEWSISSIDAFLPLSSTMDDIRQKRMASIIQLQQETAKFYKCMKGAMSRLQDYKKYEHVENCMAKHCNNHAASSTRSGNDEDLEGYKGGGFDDAERNCNSNSNSKGLNNDVSQAFDEHSFILEVNDEHTFFSELMTEKSTSISSRTSRQGMLADKSTSTSSRKSRQGVAASYRGHKIAKDIDQWTFASIPEDGASYSLMSLASQSLRSGSTSRFESRQGTNTSTRVSNTTKDVDQSIYVGSIPEDSASISLTSLISDTSTLRLESEPDKNIHGRVSSTTESMDLCTLASISDGSGHSPPRPPVRRHASP